MEQLRPTVKRDLSLFSVKAWQDGFMRALPQKLDWQYPIVFNFDGRRVNFYHLQSDFQYFKEHVTRRLIDNSGLFEELNQQFLLDVTTAKQLLGSLDNVDTNELVRLIGDIMSIYIFVVSDAFITAVPAAWESRHESEGVFISA